MLPNLKNRFDVIIIILPFRFVNAQFLYFRFEVSMTFAENLKRLCESRGTTATNLCKEMGLSTSKVSLWYGGSLPKQDVIKRMAELLDCSVADFFADSAEIEEITHLNEDEKDLLAIYRKLSRRNKHEFMSLAYEFENRNELEGDKGKIAQ